MNIREDVKFGQITFNCVAISNFKHDCDADIMQEEHIKSVVLNEIKKFILEDFAAKLYSLYESYENVKWCQILDTAIDNADDVYAWYLTFTLK